MIIETVKKIHKEHRLADGDVSSHTKNAQKITKKWQSLVCMGDIKSEVVVSPENKEKIDIVDFENRVAYELKVSGKNTHHEFYKDLVKVLTFNEYNEGNSKIKKFVFISERTGIEALKGRLDSKFVKLIGSTHFIEIELISI